MKRLLIILLAFCASVTLLFAGCSSLSSDNEDNSDPTDTVDDGAKNENVEDKSDNEDNFDTSDTVDDGTKNEDIENKKEITEMYITVNGNKLKVTLAENSTVDALAEILKRGDITYTAHANNFEIYGDIGHDLTTKNDTHMTSEVGDVFLWAGDNICIFFGRNSYSYTKIGKIEGYSASELKAILAPTSNVQVTISLK